MCDRIGPPLRAQRRVPSTRQADDLALLLARVLNAGLNSASPSSLLAKHFNGVLAAIPLDSKPMMSEALSCSASENGGGMPDPAARVCWGSRTASRCGASGPAGSLPSASSMLGAAGGCGTKAARGPSRAEGPQELGLFRRGCRHRPQPSFGRGAPLVPGIPSASATLGLAPSAARVSVDEPR